MSEPWAVQCAASDADANGYQQPCGGEPWTVIEGVRVCFDHFWQWICQRPVRS